MRNKNWLLATALTVGLIGATHSALAAPQTLTNSFNSAETAGSWNINFGTGTIEWNPTNGVDGSGCMMAVLSSLESTNKEVAPLYVLGDLAFSTADYVMLEYDFLAMQLALVVFDQLLRALSWLSRTGPKSIAWVSNR